MAANALDGRPQILGGRLGVNLADVGVQRATGPMGITGKRLARSAGRRCPSPPRGNVGLADASESELDGAIEVDQTVGRIGNELGDVAVAADGGVFE